MLLLLCLCTDWSSRCMGKATGKTVIYIVVLLFLMMQKHLSEFVLLPMVFCLLPRLYVWAKEKTRLFTFDSMSVEILDNGWFMDCLWSALSQGWLLRPSQRTLKGNEDLQLGGALSLFLSLSAASFSNDKDKLSLPVCRGKVTWKTGVGCLSALHMDVFFLLLSHPHSSSPAHFLSDRGGQDKQRFWKKRTADWSNCFFANSYGLRFLLSAVNLPYCDLQWVYVPSSRYIRAPGCLSVVWVYERMCGISWWQIVHLLTCCLLSWW